MILIVGILLSIAFHFIGVYAGAKNIVWVVIALMWTLSISIATNEVKPKGYDEIQKMKGQFDDTDKLITEAGEVVSLYEFLTIKKSYIINNPKK